MNFETDKLFEHALEKGASYADVRLENSQYVLLETSNSKIDKMSIGVESGIGIRVLKEGSWGFAYGIASDWQNLLSLAFSSISLTNRFKKEDVSLIDVPTIKDRVDIPVQDDFRDYSIEDKTKLILEADQSMKDDIVKSREIMYRDIYQQKFFANSEGTSIHITTPYLLLYCKCTVKDAEGGTLQATSRLGHIGGMEIFKKESPQETGRRALIDALEGIKAPQIKPGKYNCVLDGAMNGLFAHEACGHSAEADFCRTAGVFRGKLNKKVAAKNVTLVDDGSLLKHNGNNFYGYIPYDDEGVKSRRVEIIVDGVLKHYMTDRATAHYWNLEATGNARAQYYSDQPIVRMRNTWLEATNDPMTTEELVEEIKDGLLLKKSSGGQVDPIRGTFNFGTDEIRLIENGEINDRRRPTTCSGNTLQTLKNIIGLNNTFDNPEHSIGHCGKGSQSVPTSIAGGWMAVKNVVIGG